MKVYPLLVLWIFGISDVFGQTITLQTLEASFLSNHYALIASKYEIDIAEAERIQEKLWDNPSLQLSEVNLWKTSQVEQLSTLFGTYGRNQQFSLELEQLIETAGKRRKRVAIKELNKQSAIYAYEELLQELLKTLRQTYFSLARSQEEKEQLDTGVELFDQLKAQYQRQSERSNVSKADFYRVQTELNGLRKEKVELENHQTDLLQTLRVLSQRSDLLIEQIDFTAFQQVSKPLPIQLQELARLQNIGLKRQQNEIQLVEKELQLEKAKRIPDLTFQAKYDRGGNIMADFVGIGVSLDLPVFNTNKGGIRAAKMVSARESVEYAALCSELDVAVGSLQQQILRLERALREWKVDNTSDQRSLMDAYKKHLLDQQITLLEFIDFTQAHRDSHRAYLELVETYQNTFESLKHLVGQDL